MLAVCPPERDSEILVESRVKIGPDYVRRPYYSLPDPGFREVYETDAHLGILFASLWIMRAAERAVLPEGRIDGEHGHLAVVITVEGQFLAVGAPPERAVVARAAEYLFEIHPGGIAVQDYVGAVGGDARHLPGPVLDVEVAVEIVRTVRRIGRPAEIAFFVLGGKNGRNGQKQCQQYPFHSKNRDGKLTRYTFLTARVRAV